MKTKVFLFSGILGILLFSTGSAYADPFQVCSGDGCVSADGSENNSYRGNNNNYHGNNYNNHGPNYNYPRNNRPYQNRGNTFQGRPGGGVGRR
jgi:hypothetical protein